MLTYVVYNLPQDILSTLAQNDHTETGLHQNTVNEVPESLPDTVADNAIVGAKACSLCAVTFPTVEEQRSHIRSDLHSYNLKQKIRGGKSVSEGDFEKLVGGMCANTRDTPRHVRASTNGPRS